MTLKHIINLYYHESSASYVLTNVNALQVEPQNLNDLLLA